MRPRNKNIHLSPAQQLLVEENHDLIYGFLRRKNLNAEEWYDLAAIGLCKAAFAYDATTGNSFSTYAYCSMENAILNELHIIQAQKHIPQDKIISLDKDYQEDSGHNCTLFNIITTPSLMEDEVIIKKSLHDFYLTLKEKKKEILTLYALGHDTNEIAEYFGDTYENIRRIRGELKKEYYRQAYR